MVDGDALASDLTWRIEGSRWQAELLARGTLWRISPSVWSGTWAWLQTVARLDADRLAAELRGLGASEERVSELVAVIDEHGPATAEALAAALRRMTVRLGEARVLGLVA